MKQILWVIMLLALFILASCSKRPSPDEIAAQVAKNYYELLLKGHYDQYVDAHYQPDSIPSSYREQLIKNARMFMEQQQQEHRGIKQVSALNAKADTIKHVANAFLSFSYGDHTTEEIVVPMIYHKGVWYLK